MPEYRVIDDPGAFRDAVFALAAGSGPLAVDVERASGYRYFQRAYLVQLFRRGAPVVLVDPIAVPDVSALQQTLGDTEWVLHAAGQDLPSLAELGLVPARMFDTELAARLLGWERVGLGAVVERTLGIELRKAHSAADWSTRPLPADWLEYAALDVVHLIDVYDHLTAALEAAGKVQIASEEFEAVRTREPKAPPTEPWRRLSGLHRVRGARSLAIARELWQAREELAIETDTAPSRLVPDRSLVAAVLASPRTKGALAGLADFTGRASRPELERWWAAIERGRTVAIEPEPPRAGTGHPPHRTWNARKPEAAARLAVAREAVDQIASDLNMPVENLLTPETLRRMAWDPPATLTPESIAAAQRATGAREWQIQHTSAAIADAFVRALQAHPDPDARTSEV